MTAPAPRRFASLPWIRIRGLEVPVAEEMTARTLGLAFLDRERAGPGLLIPSCRSVHTFGMRFCLDLLFLDHELRVVAVRRAVPPWKLAGCLRAEAVLELPAGGESAAPAD